MIHLTTGNGYSSPFLVFEQCKSIVNYDLCKGLGYSQQAKISVNIIDINESFLRKGYHFPMLAMELFTKERKRMDKLNG